jgi:alcohol dehydrogenase
MRLPDYYEFCCRVKIVAGHDALEKIPALLGALHAARPMIITDRGVAGAGLLDVVVGALQDGIVIGAVADEVPSDSDFKVVRRLAKVYQQKDCDAIVAVGGGSVMDTAKGVNILVSEGGDDLMAFTGAGALKKRLKPLVAVPTTAGTGSEVTLVAVIADHEKNLKIPFTSYFLLPDIAVIDSRMTLTLPDVITSQTAMDALCHAVEAYTCLAKNPVSDACALEAISLIAGNLLKVMKTPADRDGRLALATAATLAGMAFSNSMVGMVHTLGHSVGAVCQVPHGTCMAVLLPYGLEYNMHKNGEEAGELLFALGGDAVFARTPRDRRAKQTVASIRALNQDLYEVTGGRHPRCLGEVTGPDGKIRVPRAKLPEIARVALGDASIFYNPEALDEDDLLMVLEAAWEGIPLDPARIRKG